MTIETTRRYYRVDRCQVGFVKFILEAYDNVAVLSTVDSKRAVVTITIAPGCERMVDHIMTGLAGDIGLIPLNHGELDGVDHVDKRRSAGES
jgi:hypothetical protein